MSEPEDLGLRELHVPLPTVVREFMQIGGQTVDKFNVQQACLYTGLQFEELAEKMKVLAQGAVTERRAFSINYYAQLLTDIANEFKGGKYIGEFLRADHDDLIDADYDLSFVSLGAICSTSPLPLRAVAHGNFTNMAKFPDGKAERDENGKIKKPPGWKPPDFSPYVDTRIRD